MPFSDRNQPRTSEGGVTFRGGSASQFEARLVVNGDNSGAGAGLVLRGAPRDTKLYTVNNQQGVAAFVVKYRMQEYGFPAPLLDGLRAVRYVRAHAANWNLDAERIGVLGFSAGGHLAASVATRYSFRSAQLTDDPWQNVSARPDFAILGYPVITLEGPDAHAGSRQALLGDNPTPELVRENSLQYQVKAKVPPMFIIHGANDKAVPIGNSLALFAEVQKHNKQSELHIYQTNAHGFGMREGEGTASDWPDALLSWLRHNGWLEKPARQLEVQP